ncbi:16921_t:CDS:2, partial [Racocetra fulgida]
DRYYGTNDPVAKKILNRVKGGGNSNITPPEDKSIVIVVVHKSKCAFVNYATRASAEQAIDKSHNTLNIKGHALKVAWGRPRPTGPKTEVQAVTAPQGLILPSLESMEIPAPPGETPDDKVKFIICLDPTYQGSTNK